METTELVNVLRRALLSEYGIAVETNRPYNLREQLRSIIRQAKRSGNDEFDTLAITPSVSNRYGELCIVRQPAEARGSGPGSGNGQAEEI